MTSWVGRLAEKRPQQQIRHFYRQRIRMEDASSRPDYLPTLSAAKTAKHSLLVKHHILAIDEAS